MRAPTSRLFAVPRAVAAEAFAPGEDVAFLEGAASASAPPAPGLPGPTHRYGRLVRWVGGSATGGGSDEAEVEDSPEGSVRRLPAAALFKLQAPIRAAAAAAPAADGGPTADSAAPPSAEPGSGPSPAAAVFIRFGLPGDAVATVPTCSDIQWAGTRVEPIYLLLY